MNAPVALYLKWVREQEFCRLTGNTPKGIQHKRYSGIWIEGVHWKKAPDGTIHINLEQYNKWIEGE